MRINRSIPGIAVSIIALSSYMGGALGCTSRPDSGREVSAAVGKRSSVPSEIKVVWEKHWHVLSNNLEHDVPIRDYISAVKFFEDTTGISGGASYSYVGRMPSLDLGGDLKRWDEWFQANGPSLYLDPTTGKILTKKDRIK